MPHLDASAVTEDQDGLEFLGRVLDVPARRLPRPDAFTRPAMRALRATKRAAAVTIRSGKAIERV